MDQRPSSRGVWALSSDCIHPCQEFDERTDRLQLVLPQSAQLLLAESPLVQESPKQPREPRIATVIVAVDPFTAFDHVIFPIPQIRQLLNRVGHLLCFLNHSVKLPTQSSVEGCAGNGFFWTRPNRFALVGIGVWPRRLAHLCVLRRGILCLCTAPFLLEWTLSPWQIQRSRPAAARPTSI